MAEAMVDDWQSNRSLAETNKFMWTHKIDCDVTFVVGPDQEEVKAHKYILMSRSSVFYTMFKGSIPVDTNKPIHVPDITPDIFKDLCLYLYTETVQITLDNVLALLHAAKIYLVQALIDKCLHKLRSKLYSCNFCMIMEACHVFGENELWEMCRKGILRNPREVLPTETLAELCSECLESIIKDDFLRMEEEEIFECLIRYSEERCQKECLAVTPKNQRKILGNVLYQIRFTQMDSNYFCEKVERTGLLTNFESKAVMLYFLKPDVALQLPFNPNRRNLQQMVKRFQTHNAGWVYNYRSNADAISCKCDKAIQLHGILTYGSCDGPKEFDVKVTLIETDTGATKVLQVFKVKSDGRTKYYDCIFNNPVQIKHEEKFTIVLVMKPGKTTYFGENGYAVVEQAGVTFRFMNSNLSLNNTTYARGQILGLIFSVGS